MDEYNKKLYLDSEDSAISHLKISTNLILNSTGFRNSILVYNTNAMQDNLSCMTHMLAD